MEGLKTAPPRASRPAADLFVELLCTVAEVRTRRGSIAGELHDVGLLLAMIPEFAPVMGRVHHDIYHVYTVDEHTLFALGIMHRIEDGKLTQDHPLSAEVILLSDPEHAIPVHVNRNGLRTIATGTGQPTTLALPYLSRNADIRVGDLLVSSGLGGVFPAGYPVGRVTEVRRDPAEPLAVIRAVRDAGVPAGLKWPNDVMVSGRKAGGMLIGLHGDAEPLLAHQDPEPDRGPHQGVHEQDHRHRMQQGCPLD